MDIPVIYEDDGLMVINKPAGMVVFPEGQTKDNTVIDYLTDKYPLLKNAGAPPRYGIIHRLDKDTSGVLLIAKNDSVLQLTQKQFKNREIEKKYRALVYGKVNAQQGIIDTLINRSLQNRLKQKAYPRDDPEAGRSGSRQAITAWRLIESFGDKESGYSLLELLPKTGRKHQIRAHLAYLGHPIVNDKLYSFKDQKMIAQLNRQFLHAYSLRVIIGGKSKEFIARLPQELEDTLKVLKSQKYANN